MQPNTSQDGPIEARERFHALYDANAPAVAAYALRRRSSADAADVVAETFVVAWRRIDEIPEGPAAKPWLLGVARRVIANQRRGQRRRDRLATRMAERFEDRRDELAPLDHREDVGAVGAALRLLSDADRELLLLVAWEQLTPAEIAMLLGTSSSVIRKRLHRARARLRRRMDEMGADDPSRSPELRPTIDLPESNLRLHSDQGAA